MMKTHPSEDKQNLRGWMTAIGAVLAWLLLATNSAEAQTMQVPDFVRAQVLGDGRAATPHQVAAPHQAVAPRRDGAPRENVAAINLVAHEMRVRLEDQLVAGVNRPSVELEVHFDFDSDVIHVESTEQIEAAAEVLSHHFPKTRFRVAGYTDAAGAADYNQSLSERRAMAVWQRLVEEHGVPAERLESVGFGENGTGLPEDDASAIDAKQRRVELQILRGEARAL